MPTAVRSAEFEKPKKLELVRAVLVIWHYVVLTLIESIPSVDHQPPAVLLASLHGLHPILGQVSVGPM